jgi:predicted esterase
MKSLLICLSMFISCTNCFSQQSVTLTQYLEHWQKAQQAIETKNFDEAVKSLKQVTKLLPYEPSSQALLAHCLAKTGSTEEAIAMMKQAITHGWCDVVALQNHADYAWLRQQPQYEEINKLAQAAAEEPFALYASKEPTRLVVLLHGLGAGPRSELPYWKAFADEHHLVIVAPRGITSIAPHLVGWHQRGVKDSKSLEYYDPQAGVRGADEAIDFARKQFPKLNSPTYLAGFSQGGGMALRMMQYAPDRFAGALVVASLCQTPGEAQWKPLANQTKFRLIVACGKLDPHYQRHATLCEQLSKANVSIKQLTWNDMGHEYPSDFAKLLSTSANWLFKDK